MARYTRRKDERYQANIVIGMDPQTGKYKYRTILYWYAARRNPCPYTK